MHLLSSFYFVLICLKSYICGPSNINNKRLTAKSICLIVKHHVLQGCIEVGDAKEAWRIADEGGRIEFWE